MNYGRAKSRLTVILSLSDSRHAYMGNLGTTEVNNSIDNLFYLGEAFLWVYISSPLTIENLPVLRRGGRIRFISLFRRGLM